MALDQPGTCLALANTTNTALFILANPFPDPPEAHGCGTSTAGAA